MIDSVTYEDFELLEDLNKFIRDDHYGSNRIKQIINIETLEVEKFSDSKSLTKMEYPGTYTVKIYRMWYTK